MKVNPFFVWRQLQVYILFFFFLLLSPCQSQKHFVLIKIDKRAADKGNSGQATAQGQPYRPNPARPDDSRSAATLTPLHFRFGPVQRSSVHFSSFCFGALSLPPFALPLLWTVWYAYFPFSILAYASFCFCFISGACQIVKNLEECSR